MAQQPTSILALAVFGCVIIFPIAHFLWRKRSNPPASAPTEFGRIDAIKLAWVGASAPQAVCMVIWPIFPKALTVITEAPLLLIPTGVAAITLLIGDVLDWK